MVKVFLDFKMVHIMMVIGQQIKWMVMLFKKGTFKWKSGCIYTGHFINDQRNGKGNMIYPYNFINIKYEGNYLNDKKEGYGELTTKNGKYTGYFHNDVFDG